MVLKYAFLLFVIINAQWTCDAMLIHSQYLLAICFSSIVTEAKSKTGVRLLNWKMLNLN